MSPLITESKLGQLAGFLEKLQNFENISKDFSQFVEIMSEKINLIQQDPPEQPPEEA